MLESSYWNPILDGFIEENPNLADKVVDWYPVRQMEILVKLDNDEKFIFNFLRQETYQVPTGEEFVPNDELAFRYVFSARLTNKMSMAGVSQIGLAESTGLSQVVISRYINCKATPSIFNLVKICYALKCTPDELTYFIK